MTLSIKDVARDIGMDVDPEVIAAAEGLASGLTSRAVEIAEGWGGRTAIANSVQIAPDGTPDTESEHALHIAALRVAAAPQLAESLQHVVAQF